MIAGLHRIVFCPFVVGCKPTILWDGGRGQPTGGKLLSSEGGGVRQQSPAVVSPLLPNQLIHYGKPLRECSPGFNRCLEDTLAGGK